MQEKHLEKRQNLHMIFVDLEKAYDRVPRDIIWWALRKKQVGEEYTKVIQDMYDGCTTSVRTLIGSTESFEVKVGLHQGSALSPLLFIIIMDVISQEVGRGPPHAMLFADDLVLCENARKEAEEQLELWEERSRIRDCESAGARQNIYHHLHAMTVKLNLVKKRSRM